MQQSYQGLTSDRLVELSNEHFHKLASLSAKTHGAVELGKVAAAKFTAATDDVYLQKMAQAELGQDHLEKLAQAIINEEVTWDELSELEKVAVFGALRRAAGFFTKGRGVKMPRMGASGGGRPGILRRGWNRVTGQGFKNVGKGGGSNISGPRTRSFGGGSKPTGGGGAYRQPSKPASAAKPPSPPPQQAGAQMRQSFQDLNKGNAPLRGNKAVQRASRDAGGTPGQRKPLLKLRHKAGIAGAAALAGGTYLGGEALRTADTFLHQRQGPYQYGMGSPSHFMQSQGM